MQLSALITLLPLLALHSLAAPACGRKAEIGSDLSAATPAQNRWRGGDGNGRWRQGGGGGDAAAPSPAPQPSPAPEPAPQPVPAPVDKLEPVQDDQLAAPMPAPTDTFDVAPMPTPTPDPVPVPAPAPAPAPVIDEPQPVLEDTEQHLAPVPDTLSIQTVPNPAPTVQPSPEPVPAPTPTPTPDTQAAPVTRGASSIGLAMNWESKANVPSFGGNIGWYYSWGLDPLPGTEGLEFIPMVHSANEARSFNGQLPAGTTHILGVNEPDISGEHGGTLTSPADAAEHHKLWTSKLSGNVKIGSPSVARGGQKWMDDWLAACGGGCRYDFVPFHYYGTDAEGLIQYTKDFYAHFKKPLWLTEFACHDYGNGKICTQDEVAKFMTTFFTWADSAEGKGMLERWSWFGAFPSHAATNANGILNADGTANEIGKLYASF